jgi:hypothetical protein
VAYEGSNFDPVASERLPVIANVYDSESQDEMSRIMIERIHSKEATMKKAMD